jgi:hypothetical protein
VLSVENASFYEHYFVRLGDGPNIKRGAYLYEPMALGIGAED